jgi:hypothetical protein
LKTKPKKTTETVAYKLNCEKTTKKSTDLKIIKINITPAKIKKSPTLLINIAFKADLTAWIRELQKLIKRNEHKPTPSQPKNNTTKLVERTKITIKKVKRDIKDTNLLL